jgi:ferritin
MKIQETINKLLNDQVVNEQYSANLYLSAASWCKVNRFNGAAAWLYKHGKEERTHADAFMEFANEYGGCITFQAIPCPPSKFKDVREIFTTIAQHEDKVTAQINKIAETCLTLKDQNTYTFAQKYVAEQLEEMAVARENLDYLALIEDCDLFLFDRELNSKA